MSIFLVKSYSVHCCLVYKKKWVKAIKVIVEVVSPKGQLFEIGDDGHVERPLASRLNYSIYCDCSRKVFFSLDSKKWFKANIFMTYRKY